jgi:hypothetical protein
MRFLFNLLATALALPFYLEWGRAQAEEQIDEMQRAAFNTPGAESPVPPAVILGGMGMLAGHFALARLLGLRFWQALFTLVGGVAAGVGLYLVKAERDGS